MRDQRLRHQGSAAPRRAADKELGQDRRRRRLVQPPFGGFEEDVERGAGHPQGGMPHGGIGVGVPAPEQPAGEAHGVLEVRRNKPMQQPPESTRRFRQVGG